MNAETTTKPKTREHRALGGSLVRVSARPGAIFGQVRRGGKRVQHLLVSAIEAAEMKKREENVEKIAEQRLLKWVVKIESELPASDGLRHVTVSEFLPDFLKTIKGRVSDAHYKDVEQRCKAFATFAGNRTMVNIGPDLVQDYFAKLAKAPGHAYTVEARKKDGSVIREKDGSAKEVVVRAEFSPYTARNYRSALSSLWKCAIDRRAATTNIWTGNAAKVARGQEFVPVNLTQDEVERILARVAEPVRPILTFCAETGVRLNEARALTWPRVEEDFSKFTIARAKSGRARTLPTTERVRKILAKRWKAHESAEETEADLVFDDYSRSRIYVCFKDAVKAERIDRRARVHDLRHHVGSALASANAPIDVIMAALGHSQLSTVQRYLHHEADALTDAFRAVEAAKASAPAAKTKKTKKTRKTKSS